MMGGVVCCLLVCVWGLVVFGGEGGKGKVGVVVWGGGGGGVGEVGVLKGVEEEGIDMDGMGGRRMGGVIGGVYGWG